MANKFVRKSLGLLVPFGINGRNGVKVVVDQLMENQVPTVYKIIRRVVDGGTSAVSTTEFSTEDSFKKFLTASTAVFAIKERNQGNVVGFVNILPQDFCRSVFPMCSRGYIILDPSLGGKNIFPDVLRLSAACSMPAGFLGGLGHAPQDYGNVAVPSSVLGRFTTCVIPEGVNLLQTGWWDDRLVYVDFARQFPDLPNAKLSEKEVISRAVASTWSRSQLISPCNVQVRLSVSPLGQRTVHLRPAKEEEFQIVHNMLSSAATAGDGFGIDEFPTRVIFKDKYLVGKSLHVIEDKRDKKLIGCAVLGYSHLTRGNQSLAMMYIYLLPGYRRLGYGTVAERGITGYLKAHGYVGVLTDMLITDINAYRFASKAGYVNIGSVPRSAYVTRQGWTDAAVLLKKFDEPMTESWLRDFSKSFAL